MEPKILTFIKAIDEQFFDSFMDQGQICMNTAKWFRDFEKFDPNIGDEFEGVQMACGKEFVVRFADPITSFTSKEELDRKLESANWTELGKGVNLRLFFENENANIFSLFAVTSEAFTDNSGNYLVTEKFQNEFSHHRFVLFLEPIIFLSKMNSAISRLGKSMKCGMVHYYKLDEKLVQNLSYFHKPDDYSYQNEFRIVFEDNGSIQQIFSIGSLNGICIEINVNIKYHLEIIDDDHFLIKSVD